MSTDAAADALTHAQRRAEVADAKSAEELARTLGRSYMRGWRAGAYGSAQDPYLTSHEVEGAEYERGYLEGYTARREAREAACARLGHTPAVLRTVVKS